MAGDEQIHHFDVTVYTASREIHYPDMQVISHSKEHAADVGVPGRLNELYGRVRYVCKYVKSTRL